MRARTQEISFQGVAGPISCILDSPTEAPTGWALVLHPHPLHGGARENKIVTTIARACVQHGLLALRPNFRGVGASGGEFDHAVGETADMVELVRQFTAAYPQAAAGKWVLAGFSFGTSVAAQLYSELEGQSEKLPDVLIMAGSAVDRFKYRDISVPEDTYLVHGEADEVVPLSEAMGFARQRDLPIVVVPDAGHFFHGKLIVLRRLLEQRLASV